MLDIGYSKNNRTQLQSRSAEGTIPEAYSTHATSIVRVARDVQPKDSGLGLQGVEWFAGVSPHPQLIHRRRVVVHVLGIRIQQPHTVERLDLRADAIDETINVVSGKARRMQP